MDSEHFANTVLAMAGKYGLFMIRGSVHYEKVAGGSWKRMAEHLSHMEVWKSEGIF